MASAKDFKDRVASLSNRWLGLVRKFENFELHKRTNIPSIRVKITDFKNRLLDGSDGFEKLVEAKNAPEIADSYFLHMRLIDLKKVEKKYDRLAEEFKKLEMWVDEESSVITQQRVEEELDLFGGKSNSGLMNDVHDENYEELMLTF